eukprot:GHVL01018825.1.p1 GENE.GHVL01018825.1~~GHVL01018825.1.p1  ORF type:complete len:322 (+),score=48.53 GHVL01018825.1:178-1143(+)
MQLSSMKKTYKRSCSASLNSFIFWLEPKPNSKLRVFLELLYSEILNKFGTDTSHEYPWYHCSVTSFFCLPNPVENSLRLCEVVNEYFGRSQITKYLRSILCMTPPSMSSTMSTASTSSNILEDEDESYAPRWNIDQFDGDDDYRGGGWYDGDVVEVKKTKSVNLDKTVKSTDDGYVLWPMEAESIRNTMMKVSAKVQESSLLQEGILRIKRCDHLSLAYGRNNGENHCQNNGRNNCQNNGRNNCQNNGRNNCQNNGENHCQNNGGKNVEDIELIKEYVEKMIKKYLINTKEVEWELVLYQVSDVVKSQDPMNLTCCARWSV